MKPILLFFILFLSLNATSQSTEPTFQNIKENIENIYSSSQFDQNILVIRAYSMPNYAMWNKLSISTLLRLENHENLEIRFWILCELFRREDQRINHKQLLERHIQDTTMVYLEMGCIYHHNSFIDQMLKIKHVLPQLKDEDIF